MNTAAATFAALCAAALLLAGPAAAQTFKYRHPVKSAGPAVSVEPDTASCRGIKQANPAAASGLYTLSFPAGGTAQVWCDMTTLGGGWTLVARSAPGVTLTPFNWASAAGTVGNAAAPYSIGVLGTPLTFSEILFGEHAGGNAWGSHIYRHAVGRDRLAANGATAFHVGLPTPVIGGNANFGMAAYMGLSSSMTEFFWFRDSADGAVGYGLRSDGWGTYYYSGAHPGGRCLVSEDTGAVYATGVVVAAPGSINGLGGYLCGKQGMIMVR